MHEKAASCRYLSERCERITQKSKSKLTDCEYDKGTRQTTEDADNHAFPKIEESVR